MNNLLLLSAILFGLGSHVYGQYIGDGSTVSELIRNGLLVGGGALGLLVVNFGSIAAWLGSKFQVNRPTPYYPQPPYNPNPPYNPQPNPYNPPYNPTPAPVNPERADYEALLALRDRFRVSNTQTAKDALELISQLADKLFREGF